MESAEVVIVGGVPVSFIRDGRTWHVGAEPARWYERQPWWTTAARAPKGGTLRIDVEVWQVQARIGRNERSPLVTFELVLGKTGRHGQNAAWSRSRRRPNSWHKKVPPA